MRRWNPVVLPALVAWMSCLAMAQGPYMQGPPPGYLPGPPDPAAFSGQGYGPAYATELVPDVYEQYAVFGAAAQQMNQGWNGAWISADYLIWNIEGPGGTLLGAPMAARDPNSAFAAFDPINGIRLDALGNQVVGVVPNLGGTFLKNNNAALIGFPTDNRAAFALGNKATTSDLNGARIQGGLPLFEGVLEAEAWGLAESQNDIFIGPTALTLNAVTLIPALTLLENGLPSDTNMILFSESYNASLSTNLWGTEGNWAFPTLRTGGAVEITPLLGFRYSRMSENLSISGADIPDPLGAPTVVLNHRLSATMGNHVFGPQIGMRAVLKSRWFTVGFEPKLAASVNRVNQDLSTQQIYSTTEAARLLQDHFTQFSPTLDLAFFAKVHFTENFSVRVGYDYILTGSVYRAYENINYLSPATAGDPPTIALKKDRTNMYVHGLSIGGEWAFR